MAESKNNVITRGLSGKFADQIVFRNKYGRTYATKPPGERQGEPTEKQQQVQTKFQQASVYWTTIKETPLKDEYKAAAKDGVSAYNLVVADFCQGPDILEIDLSDYTGQPNQSIRAKVVDNFKVKAVRVTISNADGSFVEEGTASSEDGVNWTYKTTAPNESLAGDKIVVTATDNPDNLAKQEMVLS